MSEKDFNSSDQQTKLKILIAEDDFTSRFLLQELLKPYGITYVAINGREALEAFRISLEMNEPYDLICLDIMMPEMNGQEVLQKLRDLETTKGILLNEGSKIMMTTALHDYKNVSAAYNSFCNAYLTKPIDKRKLLEELRKMNLIQ